MPKLFKRLFYELIVWIILCWSLDQMTQPKRYCSRKDFEEGCEETTFLLNMFIFGRLLRREDPKQGSLITFRLEGNIRAGYWAEAGCRELRMPHPQVQPPSALQREQSRDQDGGQLRPSQEVLAAMQGHPDTGSQPRQGSERQSSSYKWGTEAPSKPPLSSSSLTLFFFLSKVRLIRADLEHMQ